MTYRSFVPQRSMRFNMTPLVDVVFLLIIFFMAAAQFQKETTGEVELPRAVKAQTPRSASTNRLTINVQKPGMILVQEQHLQPADLSVRIRAAARRAGDKPLEVKIRADRDVDYGIIQSILLACARAGVWKVAFGVKPRKPEAGALPPGR